MKTYNFLNLTLILIVLSSCSQNSTVEQDNQLDSNTTVISSDTNTVLAKSNSDSVIVYSDSDFKDDSWGKGFFTDLSIDKSGILNFCDSITIFDNPNGDSIGLIVKNSNAAEYYIYFLQINGKTSAITRKDIIEVTYEGTCVKYYASKNGYYLCNVNNELGGVWIKEADLEKVGFKPIDWKQFLTQKKKRLHALHETIVPMYDSDYTIIDTLFSTGKEVKLTGKNQNDLYKVNIFNPTECVGGDGKKVGEAWIEIVDSLGKPIVFYYTRGC